MTFTGTVQYVQDVDDTESDDGLGEHSPAGASSASSGPASEVDGTDDEEMPPLIGSEDEPELPDSDESDTGQPPDLVDSASSHDYDGLPALVASDDSEGEPPVSEPRLAAVPSQRQQNRSKVGLKPGFFSNKRSKPSSSSRSYSNQGVGQREEGPSAVAGRRELERPSAPYAGAGAGVREDLRPAPPQQHYAQQVLTPQTAAAAPDWVNRWHTQAERPRARPKFDLPREQQQDRPAELFQDRTALEAFQREVEERRRARNMHQEDVVEKPPPVGRCCLNRGLHDRVEHCTQDRLTALVKPQEKRMVMKCSAGCVMMWHIPCWRIFQEGYEAETRDLGSNRQQGINITQALKVKDKQKPPVVRCVTPGCPGYITFLGSFEGPSGQETFKSIQYQPSQDNLAAIKEAIAADRQAAQAEREAAAAARAAAALAAFRKRTNWVPRDADRPRRRKRTPRERRQQPIVVDTATAVANGAASEFVGGSAGVQQPGMAETATAAAAAGVDEQQQQEQAAGASAAADTPAACPAAAPKPKGIQVKLAVKPISVLRAAVPKELSAAVDTGPVSPTAASVEGSASQSASQAQGRRETTAQLQELGRPSAHVDATYQASVEELLSQQQQQQQQEAEVAVGGRRKGRKKGVTLHVDELQSLYAAQDLAQQQQDRLDRLSGIRPLCQQQPESQTLPAAQQQAAAPSAGDFPTLDQAAMHDDLQLAETDYLSQALQELKLRADDQQTNFVLLECVDFSMMRKLGEEPDEVIRTIISDRIGSSPITIRLFEQQEAVAVMMTDIEASRVFVLCYRYQLHRKQLQPSFLRHFPFDDELHKACPQYLTPEMRAQQEELEQQRLQQQQQQQAAGEQLAEGRRRDADPEVQKLKEVAAQLTPLELFERLQSLQRPPSAVAGGDTGSSIVAASDMGAAAAGGGGSGLKAVSQQVEQRQHQQALAAHQGQPPAGKIKPPAPPPGSPPREQQQTLMPPPAQAFGAAPNVHYAQQQVGFVPTFFCTPMGAVPVQLHPVYQTPVQPLYGASQIWQQQHEHMNGVNHTWQRQQQQFDEGCEQQFDEGGGEGCAENGDWGGETWPEAGVEQQEVDEVQESDEAVEVVDSEERQAHQARSRQQGLEKLLEGRGGAASVSDTTCSTSGSPATKLNPQAKEFKVLATIGSTPSSGAATPSRLRSSSSTPTAALAPTPASDSCIAATASSNVADAPSDAAADAAMLPTAHDDRAEAASSDVVDAPSDAVADAALLTATHDDKVAAAATNVANASLEPAASAAMSTATHDDNAAAAGARPTGLHTSFECDTYTKECRLNSNVTDDRAEETPHQIKWTSTQPALGDGTESKDLALASGAVSNASSSVNDARGSSSGAVAPPTGSGDLPADHIFDVVLVAGCNFEQLETVYRNPATPMFCLKHQDLPGGENVCTKETAGLVLYNVQNFCVQGLWTAIANRGGGVHWKAVMEYVDVPAHVFSLVLAPSKRRYEGEEALAVTKMLWNWKHSASIAPVVRSAPQVPESLPASSSSPGPSSSTVATSHVMQPCMTTTPSNRPLTPPGPITAGTAQAVQRRLPPHIAMLASRPRPTGGSGGRHTVNLVPSRICTICKAQPSSWLVMGCNHMGPCAQCLVKPVEMAGKFYTTPMEYPVCLFEVNGHVCGKPVKQLFRVVM